jgi:hypothetical protein
MIMFMRRLHHLPLLCVLVLCLLTSPVLSFGYVWCLSDDGHAVLETALAGDCGLAGPSPAAAEVPALSLNAGPEDCGPCLDISAALQWGSSRGRDGTSPANLPAPLAPAAVAALTPPVNPFLTTGLIPDPAPRVSEPLLHHRTTVLLI